MAPPQISSVAIAHIARRHATAFSFSLQSAYAFNEGRAISIL
jgi:hypothetical protein